MATRRHPRTLHEVSHLFLSSGSGAAGGDGARTEAVVWIVAAGRSVNRAHLAAGAAAAFAGQGVAVSVCELSGNLPNVGYYFGLEPAEYLATALDRKAVVAGAWNGSVRFASSPAGAALGRCGGAAQQPSGHHVIVAAATAVPGGAARAGAALESITGSFASAPRPGSARPDAILVASASDGGLHAGELAAAFRGRHAESLLLFLGCAAAPRPVCADECIVVPEGLDSSWPRRMPPGDPFFGELASLLLQRIGSRRRRNADAAGG
jgi:hypothetical protein